MNKGLRQAHVLSLGKGGIYSLLVGQDAPPMPASAWGDADLFVIERSVATWQSRNSRLINALDCRAEFMPSGCSQ